MPLHPNQAGFLTSRRTVLRAAAALMVTPAFGMSPLLLIMLPIAAQALSDFFAGRRAEEAQNKLMAAQLSFQWAVLHLQAGDTNAAQVSYRGSLATLGVLTQNADGYGTRLGVQSGRIFVERGNQGGYLTPGELDQFKGYGEEGRPLPVPLEPDRYPSRIERSQGEAMVTAVAKRMGMGPNAFVKFQSPAGARRFATGRSPSYGGDMSTLLTHNTQLTMVDGAMRREVNTHVV